MCIVLVSFTRVFVLPSTNILSLENTEEKKYPCTSSNNVLLLKNIKTRYQRMMLYSRRLLQQCLISALSCRMRSKHIVEDTRTTMFRGLDLQEGQRGSLLFLISSAQRPTMNKSKQYLNVKKKAIGHRVSFHLIFKVYSK